MASTITTADTLAPTALRELFNDGFSGYLVPMHLDEPTFATHLARSDIDLGASPVLVCGDPVAFALVAIRGDDAWIGGMGTVPAARRRGRAREVMNAALEAARARGCGSVWLEVIDANRPALALYERLGFETVRDLLVWRLARSAEPSEASPLELDRAREWIAATRTAREPWQRTDSVIAKLLDAREQLRAIGVQRRGELSGAAILSTTGGSTSVLQIACRDEPTAASMLRSAAAGGPVGLGNIPEQDPACAAMQSLGAQLVARQHEMRLALGNDHRESEAGSPASSSSS